MNRSFLPLIGALVLWSALSGAAFAAEWVLDGFTAPNGSRPGFFSASLSRNDISLMVMCDPAGRRISLGVKAAGALAAAELGDKAAKAAAGGGAFDLLIQDIAYARSARFDAPNAMLRFTEPVAADGPLLRDLMSAGDLVLSNSPLKLEFSLSGARNAICAALSACRIKHPICLAAD